MGCECRVKKMTQVGTSKTESLLVAFKTIRTITPQETIDPKKFKKTEENQRKKEWTEKRTHGQFARDTEDKDTHNTWRWTRKKRHERIHEGFGM